MPPVVLYYQGDAAGFLTARPRSAVVGTRQASDYGLQAAAKRLGWEIARCGRLGGLRPGRGHRFGMAMEWRPGPRACLLWAFCGCGADVVYPP